MVETVRWNDFAFDDTKVTADVGTIGLRDEGGVALWINARLVDPGVQRRVIDVVNLLGGGDVVIQLDSIGASPTEGVTWIEGFAEFECVDVSAGVFLLFFRTGPLTFPHLDHVVAPCLEDSGSLLRFFIDVIHGAVTESQVGLVSYGIALGTTVPEATVEFVHGGGVGAIPVHEPMGVGYAILSPVAAVLNVHAMVGMGMERVSSGHEIVVLLVFVRQAVQGLLSEVVVAPG